VLAFAAVGYVVGYPMLRSAIYKTEITTGEITLASPAQAQVELGTASGELTVGSNYTDTATAKEALHATIEAFPNKNVTVKLNEVDHNTFQENITTYLQNPDDVFPWFAGYRMQFFAAQNLLGPIDDVWEAGLNDINNLVEFIANRNVEAVFVESSVNEYLSIYLEEHPADAKRIVTKTVQAALAREQVDHQYVVQFTESIRSRYLDCPLGEAEAIAKHACAKYSGRVGRSAAAKSFDATAIDLAVKAHVRHAHSEYDRLLSRGWERSEARSAVSDRVAAIMERWRRA